LRSPGRLTVGVASRLRRHRCTSELHQAFGAVRVSAGLAQSTSKSPPMSPCSRARVTSHPDPQRRYLPDAFQGGQEVGRRHIAIEAVAVWSPQAGRELDLRDDMRFVDRGRATTRIAVSLTPIALQRSSICLRVLVIPVLDPRKHCDAMSRTSVPLQFVAIDRRQLRLVR
jgi:hypothetical protein